MTYAVVADLVGRFSAEEVAQRTDRNIPRLVSAELLELAVSGGDTSGYTADELAAVAKAVATAEQALLDADNVINGYLAKRYTVPVTNALPALQRFACDIARYFIYEDQVTETIETRYNAAIKFLRDVAKGDVNLGDPAATPARTSDLPVMTSDPVNFRRDSSKGFV